MHSKEGYSGVDIHTAVHGRPHTTSSRHALMEAAANGEPSQEQAPGKISSLWGPTLKQTISEGLYLVERNNAGAAHERLQPVRRTYAGAGKKCDKTGGTIMTDHNPHSPPSSHHSVWVGE